MADKKIYVGNGKKKSETWFKATINVDKLKDHIKEYKGNRIVKLDINVYGEADQYGKDVKITIDTWEPEGNRASTGGYTPPTFKSKPVENCPQPERDDDPDSLPF